jgi:hypothetical protein
MLEIERGERNERGGVQVFLVGPAQTKGALRCMLEMIAEPLKTYNEQIELKSTLKQYVYYSRGEINERKMT